MPKPIVADPNGTASILNMEAIAALGRGDTALAQQKRAEAEDRQQRSAKTKDARQKVYNLEKQVQALETKQAELTKVIEHPDTYNKPGEAMRINREMADVADELAKCTARWEEASTALAALEGDEEAVA